MKKFNLRNLLSFMMLIFFVSCNENEGLDANYISDTGLISFGLSEASTKTSYDAADKLRINWENGDKVKVSCEQSQGVKESVYEVLRSTTATNEGTLQGVSSDLLMWNPNAGDHIFYGAYPGESATINGSQITCKCAVNQTVTNAGDNVYTPDMTNACMVATSTAKQTTSSVKLNFVPAFTALDIEIPVSATNPAVTLSSLTVTLNNRLQYISTDGEFILDCSDIANGYTFTTYSGAPSSIGFSANIPAPITIAPGKKAVITLLLPPIIIAANTATITADLDGTLKTTSINTEIAGGTRRTIKMGELQPAPSVDSIVIRPSNTTLIYGLVEQLQAIAYYPDGTTKDVTYDAGIEWNYAGTVEGADASAGTATVGNTTADKGLVTLIKRGTSKITASYTDGSVTKSATATIKPNISREFTVSDYFQWDAYSHFNPDNLQEGFGQNSSGHNTILSGVASHSCKNAPYFSKVREYLGNGIYTSWTDGLIFTVEPDGTGGEKLYCKGVWLKKQTSWTPGYTQIDNFSAETDRRRRPADSEIGDYFFLPACGAYGHVFDIDNTPGLYWLGTTRSTSNLNPDPDFPEADVLIFNISGAGVKPHVAYYSRYNGYVPMSEGVVNELKLDYIKIESTTGSYVVAAGKTLQMKATAHFSDVNGAKVTRDVTNEATWGPGYNQIIEVGEKTGLVTAYNPGTSDVTVSYIFGGKLVSDAKAVDVGY